MKPKFFVFLILFSIEGCSGERAARLDFNSAYFPHPLIRARVTAGFTNFEHAAPLKTLLESMLEQYFTEVGYGGGADGDVRIGFRLEAPASEKEYYAPADGLPRLDVAVSYTGPDGRTTAFNVRVPQKEWPERTRHEDSPIWLDVHYEAAEETLVKLIELCGGAK